jgi:hypothetical protein
MYSAPSSRNIKSTTNHLGLKSGGCVFKRRIGRAIHAEQIVGGWKYFGGCRRGTGASGGTHGGVVGPRRRQKESSDNNEQEKVY